MDVILYYASLLALPVLVVGWPLVAWRHWGRGGLAASGPVRAAVTAALIGAPIFAVWAVYTVLQRTSSTAPVGLLMVPIYTLAAGVWLGLAVGAGVELVAPSREGAPSRLGRWRRPAAAVLLAALAWWPVHTARSEMRAERAQDAGASALEALFESSSARRDPYVMAALAANPACPPELLAALAAEGRPGYRRRLDEGLRVLLLPPPGNGRSVLELVAGHPQTPSATLESLAADPSPGVRAAAAANPNTPPEALRRLADDPELPVQVALAVNRATPPDVLSRLGEAESVYVRLRVAANPEAPEGTLEALAADPESLVRREVAANPKTPPAILSRLAGDEDPEVRFRLTTNPSLPGDLLQALAGDADEKVSSHAAQKLR